MTSKGVQWNRVKSEPRGRHLYGRKGLARYWQCRPTLFVSEKKEPDVQDSFCLLGGCIAHTHRPTQVWTVGEYILTWQSKLASSTVQPWVGRLRTTPSLIWRHTGSAEEAFLLLFAIRVANSQFPCCEFPVIVLRIPNFRAAAGGG